MRGRRLLPFGAWLVLAGALVGAPPRSVLAGDPDDEGAPRLRRAKPAWTTTLGGPVVAITWPGWEGAPSGVFLRSGSLVRMDERGNTIGRPADLGVGEVLDVIPGGVEGTYSVRGTGGTAFVDPGRDDGKEVRARTSGEPPDGAYLAIDASRSVFVLADSRLRFVWDREGERAQATLGSPHARVAPVAVYDAWRDVLLTGAGDSVEATRILDAGSGVPWDAGGRVVRLLVDPLRGTLAAGREDGSVRVRRGTEETTLAPPTHDVIDPADWDGGPVVALALDPGTTLLAVARGGRTPPAVLVQEVSTGHLLYRCLPPEGAAGTGVALAWVSGGLLCAWGERVSLFPMSPRGGVGWTSRSGADSRPEMLSAGIEPLLRPAGVEGMPVQVAAGSAAWATVWSDGSVTIRAEGRVVRRAPPPGDGETFRRAAVTGAGAVVALTSRGRLVELADEGPRPIPVTGIQSSARLAPDARSADHLWVGGESGTLFRLGVRDATLEAVSGDGQAPITALASEHRGALVGRADGTVVRYKPGVGDTPPLLSARGSIALLATGRSWDGAVASDGLVHAFWVPVVEIGVEGRIVAIAARDEDLVVFHEPCCVTRFSMRNHAPIAVAARFLDGRVRAACAIDGGFLVATDAGERIVRFGVGAPR